MGLSPLEIRKQEFKKSLWGYNKSDVDLFQENVEETVNDLINSNVELQNKIEAMNERIQRLENQSSAIKEAIKLAKKEADRIIEEAILQAENVRKKAEDEIKETQEELFLKIKEKKEELYGLQNLKDSFKQRFLYFLEEEGKLIDRFESEHQTRRAKEILEGIGAHEVVSDPVPFKEFLRLSLHLRNHITD